MELHVFSFLFSFILSLLVGAQGVPQPAKRQRGSVLVEPPLPPPISAGKFIVVSVSFFFMWDPPFAGIECVRAAVSRGDELFHLVDRLRLKKCLFLFHAHLTQDSSKGQQWAFARAGLD